MAPVPTFSDGALFLCAFWIVAGPLLSKPIEEKVEWLSLGLGVFALTASWSWTERAVIQALARAASLSGALVAGALFFSLAHAPLRRLLGRLCARFGARPAVAAAVALSGLATPFVTAGVAVLLLVEVLAALPLEEVRRKEAAVLGCCAIGLGAGLSAVGGPAAAVLLAKLSGAAYPVTGPFLFVLVGPWLVPGIVGLALGAAVLCGRALDGAQPRPEDPFSLWNLLVLTGRLFVFTVGLVLLGEGLTPLIERTFQGLHPAALYWANAAAAFTDNAALVAVEISPAMSQDQLRHAFLGALTSGGALLAGDPPNLVAAHKLDISARDWARVGVPASAALMLACFFSLAAL